MAGLQRYGVAASGGKPWYTGGSVGRQAQAGKREKGKNERQVVEVPAGRCAGSRYI